MTKTIELNSKVIANVNNQKLECKVVAILNDKNDYYNILLHTPLGTMWSNVNDLELINDVE